MIRTLLITVGAFVAGYLYAEEQAPVVIESESEDDARGIVEDAIREANESRSRGGR